jgi:colanic acid biosynthesis glycosyl transferase WcaI
VKQGVPDSKIVCIPNWVDVNFIRPYLGKTTHFVMLIKSGQICCSLCWEHCLNRRFGNSLTSSCASTSHSRNCFVIVGEPKATQKLQDYCHTCGADNVRFSFPTTGRIANDARAANVSLIMQKRNVTLYNMPSKTPVLLASGRPIVASVPPNSPAAKAVQQSKGGIVVARRNLTV